MTPHILVVDNDPLQRKTAEINLQNKLGYQVSLASSGAEAISLINTPDGHNFDAILLDLSMPGVNGIDVLKAIRPLHAELPIIIHTAHGDVQRAIEALKHGASDFIEKQDGIERLKVCLENVLRMSNLQGQLSRMQRSLTGEVSFSDIIGNSEVLKQTKILAKKAGQSNIPVLIKGDSGVGKELFARAVHGCSGRSGEPFIAVNCGAIPENIVESVLFGHEKGAFTGAIEKTKGKFREAEGGTLFLDEIGELRPDIQVKLLRAIQEGEVEPVGCSKTMKVDVRLISATNRNLKEDVSTGKFREDLYYRINVFPFTIPPLRARKDDITDLLEFFTKQFNTQEGKQITGLTQNLMNLLSEYAWPGNVRQLENAVYRAVVMCDDTRLDVEDFAHIISAIYESNENLINDDILESLNKNQRGYFRGLKQHTQLNLLDEDEEFKRIHVIEAEIIKSALEYYEWRISKVARKLGIGRSTLYRKMHEYDLHEPTPEINLEEVI